MSKVYNFFAFYSIFIVVRAICDVKNLLNAKDAEYAKGKENYFGVKNTTGLET